MDETSRVSPRTLVLFDIDGTLLISGGAGERALIRAVNERFSTQEGLKSIELAGRTDSGIAREILRKFNQEATPENIASLLEAYLVYLEEFLPLAPGRLLPGIVPLLEALTREPEIALGLLTGNIERGARLKLVHYGVWKYFDFGAYADDHHDRNELGHFARRRALEKHGIDFPSERIFVLGDTPHDVACARAIGAKAVAIATGGSSREALAACNPDYLVADLSDLSAVLSIFEEE